MWPENPLLFFNGETQRFYIVKTICRSTIIKGEDIVAFLLQRLLREGVTMLHYSVHPILLEYQITNNTIPSQ